MYSQNPTENPLFPASLSPPPPENETYSGEHAVIAPEILVKSRSTGDKFQFPFQIQTNKPKVPWSTGLCDCCLDVHNCCLTCWCPCITFGRVAEIVDKGSNSCGVSGALYTLIACVTGCPCFYSCFYRSKMRQQFVLHENPCGDCWVHCCCELCALCQEYRELQNQGFNMRIGWHGNMEKQNQEGYEEEEATSVAPLVEGMSR